MLTRRQLFQRVLPVLAYPLLKGREMPLSGQLMQMAAAAEGSSPPPAETDVVYTPFVAANGTNVNGFALDVGGTITVTNGAMEIQSNHAIVTSSEADALVDTYYGSGSVEMTFVLGGTNANFAPCIIFRATTTTRYMMAYFSGDGALNLYNRSVGSYSLVASGSWSADASPHVGKVVFAENDVEIFVDGVSALTYSQNEATDWYGTSVGFRGYTFGGNTDSFASFTYTIPTTMVWADYPAGLSTVFSDDFGDPNGTSLLATGWSDEFGIWTTESGHAENADDTGAPENNTVVYQTSAVNHGAEVVVTTPATGTFIGGLSGRWDNYNGYVEVEVNSRVAYIGPTGAGVWYRSGVLFHPIVTHELTPTNSTSYTMRLWFRGNYVFAEVVEVGIRMAAQCAQFVTATKVGLYEANHAASGLNGNDFDDFTAIA